MGEFDLSSEPRSEMLQGVHSHFSDLPFGFRPAFETPPGATGAGSTPPAGGEGAGVGAGSGATPPAAGGEPKPDSEEPDDESDPATWDKARAARTIQAQREEARRLKATNATLAQQAKEGEAAKKKLDEAETAKLGDLERITKERDQVVARAEAAENALKAERLSGAIMGAATKLGAIDVETVAALVARDQIEYDDDGKPKNVEKLVKAVLEAKPFLKKSGQSGEVPGTPGATGSGGPNGLSPEVKKQAELAAAGQTRDNF